MLGFIIARGRSGFLFSCLCLAMGCSSPTTAKADPKMRLSEEVFDFGYTPEGPRVYHRYWLYNDGKDTLKIIDVQPSCGCTAVPLPTDLVKPGDSVPLDLAFNTRYQDGKVQKSVSITSSDKSLPEKKIHFMSIVGAAEGAVTISPRTAYLDTLGKDSQSFVIANTSNATYKISVASAPPGFLSLELSSVDLPPKGRITAILKPGPKTPIGVYTGSFTLRFEGLQPHAATVPVYGMGYYR